MKFRSVTQLVYTHSTLMDQTGRTDFLCPEQLPAADYTYKAMDNYGALFSWGMPLV